MRSNEVREWLELPGIASHWRQTDELGNRSVENVFGNEVK
jgi:hypothetical protein